MADDDRKIVTTHADVVTQTEVAFHSPDAESQCWQQGKEIFVDTLSKGPAAPQEAEIQDYFLKDVENFHNVVKSVTDWKAKTNPTTEITIHTKYINRLLESLLIVDEVADPFLESTTGEVGKIWYTIGGLIKIARVEIENCGTILELCNVLVSIILTCRVFENHCTREDEGKADRRDKEIEAEIIQVIPSLIALIFEFSWYYRSHLGESQSTQTPKETFPLWIQDIIREIIDVSIKLKSASDRIFQERVLDSVEDLRKSQREKPLHSAPRMAKRDQIHTVPPVSEVEKDREHLRKLLFPEVRNIDGKLNGTDHENNIMVHSQLEEAFHSRRKALKPNDTHTRLFQSIFRPVSRHSERLCQWLFMGSYYRTWERSKAPRGDESDSTRTNGGVGLSVDDHRVSSNRKTFYIRGKPGFGKSVAMACVIHRLMKKPDTPVCYFFFRQGDGSSQDTSKALESLLAQLFNECWANTDSKLHRLINSIADIDVDFRATKSPSDTDAIDTEAEKSTPIHTAKILVGAMESIIKALKKPVFILIDAVDECIDYEKHDLMTLLQQLVIRTENVKLMFTSRDNIALETLIGFNLQLHGVDDDRSWSFSDCITTPESVVMTITEERTSLDMDLFLRKSLKTIFSRRMIGYREAEQKAERKALAFSEDANQIVSSIKQKANGMFTYATMVIASLEQPSPMSLPQKLRKLPDGMDTLYRRRLESMGLEERRLIVLALKWVVWGWGNISAIYIAEQFKHIYGEIRFTEDDLCDEVFSRPDGYDLEYTKASAKEAIKDPEIAETIYNLRVIGRDFFKINGENYSIEVIHKSIRDWVENEASRADGGDDYPKWLARGKIRAAYSSTGKNHEDDSLYLYTKREARLDLVTYMLHALSSHRFQKRHMPYKPQGLKLNGKQDTAQDGNEALRDPNVEENHEPGTTSPADSNSASETQPGTSNQNSTSFTVSTVREKKEYRYEIFYLIEHLKDLEKLWPKEDRKGDKWTLFWRKLREFANKENYRHWQIQYSQFYMDVPEKNAYKPKLYQDLIHIAGVRSMNMVVEYLLENKIAGPDDEDGTGWTAFSIAVLKPAMWELFLKYGADPSRKDPMSMQTPFQRALRILGLEYETMTDSYKEDLVKCCLLLIPREKDINQPIDWALGKKRPLHVATLTKSWELFDALMKHPDIDVSATDQSGDSPLHTALIWTPPGSEVTLKQMITALIDAGLDPNQENRDSATALPNAITNQLKGVVELLLEKGADPKDESFTGYTALHWAAARELNVAQTIDNNVAISILKLILTYDSDFERETLEGTTPLDLAFKCRNWNFVKALLDEYEKKYGKERPYLMRRDKNNRNFLHHCAQNFRWGAEICKELLPSMDEEKVKELLSDVSTFQDMSKRGLPGYLAKAKDCAGTPLLDAVQEGHIELVKMYLRAGADITTRSSNGSTCFDEAVVGWYRSKMEATPFGDEVGLESKYEKARRYENCCKEVINTSKDLIRTSNPANLHYLIAKGAGNLIEMVMECDIDYKYEDECGWTVVEWAHAFQQEHILEVLFDIVKTKYGKVELPSEPRKLPLPQRMVGGRRNRSHMTVLDDGLTFETAPDLDQIQLDRHATAVAIFETPVAPTTQISYFEVTFLECTTTKIDGCVGFVGEFFRLNRIPGATAQGGDDSVSLFGDDGALYATFDNIDTWRLSGTTSAGEMIFGPGDTVGCGLDVKQGLIFYTLNGEYAGVGFENIHGRWYGAIGCEVRCRGKVNLGAEPFLFEGMNEVMANSLL